MKIKLIYKIIVFTVFTIFSFANIKSQPSLTWEKLYGYPQTADGAYDVCESSDGNFFVVGNSGSTASNNRLYVLKINQIGDTLWTKKYNIGEYGYGVTQSNDCGCVITGYGVDSLYILKIDCSGNIVWQRTYTGGICFDIQRVSDGGYIACGYHVFKGYVMKVDSVGNLLWDKHYTVSNQMGFISCIEAIDGGYIFGGYVMDPSPVYIELLKLDNNGETDWERRTLMLNMPGALTSIKKLGDKYIIFGITSRIFFAKFNMNGFQESAYMFPDGGLESFPAANVINDNKFVFTSQISPDTGVTMLVKNWISDSSGNILSEKTYRTNGYMIFESILPLSNKDILFAGIYKQLPHGNNDEVFVVRTDSTLYSKPLSIKLNSINIPQELTLYQNYPNPFNPVTNIKYDLPNDNFVTIKIYDLLGRELMSLVNEFKQAGSYTVTFDAANYPSGVYYYKI